MSTGKQPRLIPRVCDVHTLLIPFFVALCSGTAGAQVSKHLPIYDAPDRVVYGKVRMKNGAAPPELVTIESICGGVAFPVAFTDTQGNFRVVLTGGGPRFYSDTNSEVSDNDVHTLADCEFRAQLAGFRSQHVSPRWLKEMTNLSTISVGTIELSRPGSDEPAASPAPVQKPAVTAYKKGGAAMANRKWSEAQSEFEKVVSLQPDYYPAWIAMGLAGEALQHWPQAEAAYQKALGLSPKTADPYMRIARLSARTGNWKQAAEYSEAAMGLDPHHLTEGYALCALANFKTGRMDIAESSARAGLKLESADECPELWLVMAFAQVNAKRYPDAVASLRTYLARVPRAQTNKEIKSMLLDLQAELAAR